MSQIKLKHSGGNSVIIAAPDSNPASDRTLKLPSDGDGTILTTNSSVGKILQVKSSAKTDVASTTSTTFTAISGLSVNITPSAASSKILVTADLKVGNGGAAYFLQIVRGSTPIYIGDTESGKTPCLQQSYGGSDTGEGYYGMGLMGGTFLDTPTYNLGDTLTYSLQFKRGDDYNITLYVNRTSFDNNDYVGRGASSITVQEVAA